MIQLLTKSLRLVKLAFVAIVIIIVTILLVRAFNARSFPDLKTWHDPIIENEFDVSKSREVDTIEKYFDLEIKVFKELDEKVYTVNAAPEDLYFNRYLKESPVDPNNFKQNWNRSYELIPDKIRGGVLMIHGLTDSPYSMRHIAEIFYKQGFYVLSLRMPGHGTIPGELIDAAWQDWMAITKLGARHVRSRIPKDNPFFIVGYSNGGALAVKYSLDAIEDEHLANPDNLILLSPMIGVTIFSRFTNWHKTLSWIPFFKKFRWLEVLPEFDPFKYNSFPKNAGKQTFLLTRDLNRQLSQFANTDKIKHLPNILTFQSLVDATVITSAIVDRLYNRMIANKSELVLFDVNRLSRIEEFIQFSDNSWFNNLFTIKNIPYRLTVVTNKNDKSARVVAYSRSIDSKTVDELDLNLEWPRKTFSLSHVAIPFPDKDPLYGVAIPPSKKYINIGTFAPRGERGVLAVPISLLMRLRYNPFYDYMQMRIIEYIKNSDFSELSTLSAN